MTQQWVETRDSVTTMLPTVANKNLTQVNIITVKYCTISVKKLSGHFLFKFVPDHKATHNVSIDELGKNSYITFT
jgi:hypothetical protein